MTRRFIPDNPNGHMHSYAIAIGLIPKPDTHYEMADGQWRWTIYCDMRKLLDYARSIEIGTRDFRTLRALRIISCEFHIQPLKPIDLHDFPA